MIKQSCFPAKQPLDENLEALSPALDEAQLRKIGEGKTVTAIVPVFDEENTVGEVVETLLNSPLVNEVICINDGSTDGSLAALLAFGDRITIIDLLENMGKGFALATGIRAAVSDIVLFFDADLVTLSANHINVLLAPILTGEARVVTGHLPPDDIPLSAVFAGLSGERAYYREDLLPHLAHMENTRFGVEMFLNTTFDEQDCVVVPLVGLRGLYKYEKYPPIKALREYMGEALEVVQEAGRLDTIRAMSPSIVPEVEFAANIERLRKQVHKIRDLPRLR